jgi:LPXTG-motif cell wall-anchored protein
MKKLIAALTFAVAVLFVSLGLAVPAQAYPDNTPSQHTTTPGSTQAAPAPSSSLPNTGGPNVVLLGGGLALVAVGGVVVLSARSRQRIAE